MLLNLFFPKKILQVPAVLSPWLGSVGVVFREGWEVVWGKVWWKSVLSPCAQGHRLFALGCDLVLLTLLS